jgi:hypothetical protein
MIELKQSSTSPLLWRGRAAMLGEAGSPEGVGNEAASGFSVAAPVLFCVSMKLSARDSQDSTGSVNAARDGSHCRLAIRGISSGMARAQAKTIPHAAFCVTTLRTRNARNPAQTMSAIMRERKAASNIEPVMTLPP